LRLIIDTHVALWAVTDVSLLGPNAEALLLDEGNEVCVSVASIWEVAIKHALMRDGRPRMPVSPARFVELIEAAGFEIVPITAEHAVAVGALPSHHSDPFDRMIAAQATVTPMRLVTRDANLRRYLDNVIAV